MRNDFRRFITFLRQFIDGRFIRGLFSREACSRGKFIKIFEMTAEIIVHSELIAKNCMHCNSYNFFSIFFFLMNFLLNKCSPRWNLMKLPSMKCFRSVHCSLKRSVHWKRNFMIGGTFWSFKLQNVKNKLTIDMYAQEAGLRPCLTERLELGSW